LETDLYGKPVELSVGLFSRNETDPYQNALAKKSSFSSKDSGKTPECFLPKVLSQSEGRTFISARELK